MRLTKVLTRHILIFGFLLISSKKITISEANKRRYQNFHNQELNNQKMSKSSSECRQNTIKTTKLN